MTSALRQAGYPVVRLTAVGVRLNLRAQVRQDLVDIIREWDIPCLWVTHDKEEADDVGDCWYREHGELTTSETCEITRRAPWGAPFLRLEEGVQDTKKGGNDFVATFCALASGYKTTWFSYGNAT